MSATTTIELVERSTVGSVETLRSRTSEVPFQDTRPDAEDEVPEGGYGWTIVAACFTLSFFNVGLMYSWGVMQERLSVQNLAATSTLSFIGSLASSFVASLAIVNSKVIRWLGTRNSALLASGLMGAGQILSSFATKSVGGLFITNGVILGLGVSTVFLAISSLPSQYFSLKRGLANGIVYAGGGIGGGVLSISMVYMLDAVGVEWTFRFLGLLTLVCCLPASLLLKDRTVRSVAKVDWNLFKDPKFLLLFFGSGIATFPILVPPFFIPLYATSLGISNSVGAVLLAVWNIGSALGRVGFGALGDRIGPISSLIVALSLTTISLLAIWPASQSLAPFIVFITGNGLGNGGFFSTMPSVVGSTFGIGRLPTALAMVVSAWAFGYILGAPIGSAILEKYGGASAGTAAFRPAMIYAGSMSLGSVAFILTLKYLVSKNLLSRA